MTGRLLAGALLALWTLGAAVPSAHGLTLRLSGLGERQADGSVRVYEGAYRDFVTDLADLLVPAAADLAHSLGPLGFEVSVGYGFTFVDSSSDAWTRTTADAPGAVGVLDIGLRKGLPWSFEIAGHLAHPPGSQIWAMGLEVKAALVDGLDMAPDVAVSATLDTAVGTEAIGLVSGGGRLLVSKDFAVGPNVQLSPFGGYQLIVVRATVRALGVLDTSTGELDQFLLPATTRWVHRGYVGLRLRTGPIAIQAYGAFTPRTRRVGLNLVVRY